MDKTKTAEKLNEAFGEKTVRVFMPKQFLANLSDLLTKQNDELAKQIRENNISELLIDENKKTQILLLELKDAIKDNRVDRVEVKNFPPPQELPKYPEPKEIKFPDYPKEINLIEPMWYEKTQTKVYDMVKGGFEFIRKSFAEDLDDHQKKDRALAVRLVDAEGKTFYNAMFSVGSSGGFNGAITNWPADYPDAAVLAAINLLGHAEDTAHVSGHTGIMGLAVRNDAVAGLTTNDFDYSPIGCTAEGMVYVHDGGTSLTVDGIFWQATQPVSGTFWQATQPVSGTVTSNQGGAPWTMDLTKVAGESVQVSTGTAAKSIRTVTASDSPEVTALQLLDNSVDGNYLNTNLNIAGTDVAANAGTLNAQTQRVTIATDDEVNNLLGTIDTDTGNIATYADGINDSLISLSGPGSPTIDSYASASINLAAGNDQEIIATPGANKQIWVYGFGLSANVAGTIAFEDGTPTSKTGILQVGATGGFVSAPSGNFAMPLWKCATDKNLRVDIVTSEIDGWITYAIISV